MDQIREYVQDIWKMRTALMCMCVCTCGCLCVCVCVCVCVPSTGTSPGKAETGPDSETQACLPNVWYTIGSQYTRSLNKQKNEWVSEWIFGSPLYNIMDIATALSAAIYFPKFIHTHHSLQVVHPLHETATWTKTRRFSPSFSESKLSVCGGEGGGFLPGFLSGSSTSLCLSFPIL